MTRKELKAEVEQYILTGGRRTSAVNTRKVFEDIIDNAFIPESDGQPSGINDWDNSTTYNAGDRVWHFHHIWRSINTNTNSEPGTGSDWDVEIINFSMYDSGWSGSNYAATQAAIYEKIESLSSDYIKNGTAQQTGADFNIDGTGKTEGLFTAIGGLSTDGVRSILIDTIDFIYRIGKNAGDAATGNSNFFFGTASGYASSGSNLFLFGEFSGVNSTGDAIVAIGGYSANGNNATSVVALGGSAAYNNTGGDLVAIATLAGVRNSGTNNVFIGREAGTDNTGSNVYGIGNNAATNNSLSNLFTVSNLTDIFWNNVKGGANSVTMQSSLSIDGTNESASASVFKIAQARGTGNASAGKVVVQKANVQSSGTTRHTLSDWWVFDTDGNFKASGDISSIDSSAGLVLKSSADNHYYRYTAGVAGALTITDLGTSY